MNTLSNCQLWEEKTCYVSFPGVGGYLGIELGTYMCAAGPLHTHPINVYWNMEKYTYKCINLIEDNKRSSL